MKSFYKQIARAGLRSPVRVFFYGNPGFPFAFYFFVDNVD